MSTSQQQGQGQQEPPKIEKSFNLINPGGDPSVLRACAQAWRDMARDLKSTVEDQNAQVAALGNAWTGTAADSFHAHWDHTRTQVENALPQFETVAQQLDTAADAIAKTNAEVHRVVEQIAETVAIGIGLSVLTAGFSDAIAAGAAAAEVAEAAGEVTRLGQLLIRVAEVIEQIKQAMEDSKLLKISVELGTEFGKNFDANLIGSASGQYFSGQQVDLGADLQDSAVSAVAGTALSAVGQAAGPAIGSKIGEALAGSGAHAGPWEGGSAIGRALAGEGTSGGLLMGATTGAAGQAAADGIDMAQGHKTSDELWKDVAFSTGTGAAAGGVTGKLDPTTTNVRDIVGINSAIGAAGASIQNDLSE